MRVSLTMSNTFVTVFIDRCYH